MTPRKITPRTAEQVNRYRNAVRFLSQTEKVRLSVRNTFGSWYENSDYTDPALAWAVYRKEHNL